MGKMNDENGTKGLLKKLEGHFTSDLEILKHARIRMGVMVTVMIVMSVLGLHIHTTATATSELAPSSATSKHATATNTSELAPLSNTSELVPFADVKDALSSSAPTKEPHHKVHVITYGNERFSNSKKRIAKEALSTGWFDKVIALGPSDLPENFRQEYADILTQRRIGGYGVWRHIIIRSELEKLNPGDFLIYLDAGCTINSKGKARFLEYLDMLENSPHDIISFALSHPEHVYTTHRIFRAFNVSSSDADVYDSPHYLDGILVMQKGAHLKRFVDLVDYALRTDRWLFSDKYNDESKKEEPRFRDNRHEQSIMSVVRKKIGSIVLQDETWFQEPPRFRDAYPFWATRIRN